MTNIEIINRLKTAFYAGEDDEVYTFEFEPGLTDEQLAALAKRFPSGKIPAELREILRATRGWQLFPYEGTYFDSIHEFGFEELIPFAITLERDGLGNFWLLEIRRDGSCGKIFFACHDPAVLVIFCDTLNKYLQFVEEFYNEEEMSYFSEVQERIVIDIWKDDPNTYEIDEFTQQNPALAPLLAGYDENYVVADLRNAEMKDGFAWGKYGSNVFIKRLGNELLWVIKKKKKGLLSRWFG